MKDHLNIVVAIVIITKRVYEAQNNHVFQHIHVDMNCINMLVEIDLHMEVSRFTSSKGLPSPNLAISWSFPPEDYLKLNIDASWKDGQDTLVVLA